MSLKSNSVNFSIVVLIVSFFQVANATQRIDYKIFENDLTELLSDSSFTIEMGTSRSRNKKTINNIKAIKKTPILNFKYNPAKKYYSPIEYSDKTKFGAFNSALNTMTSNHPAPNCSMVESKKSFTLHSPESKHLISKSPGTRPRIAKPNTQPTATSATKLSKNGYWDTLHFIESSAGKRLYRKRNKARSCKWTTTPCGHHQLSVIALKDIGCTSLKCRSAREDYKKSLSMSRKLELINIKRMKKKGYNALPDYQRYLVHQQGATGLGKILDASKGKKTLSKKTLRYMANNSPYSYKKLKNAGSRGAARKFLRYWKERWAVKNSLLLASK